MCDSSSLCLCCFHARLDDCKIIFRSLLGVLVLFGLVFGRCFGVDVNVTSLLKDHSLGDPAVVLVGVVFGARLCSLTNGFMVGGPLTFHGFCVLSC